jgi:hypothetical protein
MEKPQEQKITVGTYTRTIKERPVTFRCEWCSTMGTEMRLPGPPPRYHAECKQEAQNAIAKGRMKRMREKKTAKLPDGMVPAARQPEDLHQ